MKMTDEQVKRLSKAQNHPANVTQDIMTFTAFFTTNEELERHIKYYEDRAV
jgi:hypothetical protein